VKRYWKLRLDGAPLDNCEIAKVLDQLAHLGDVSDDAVAVTAQGPLVV